MYLFAPVTRMQVLSCPSRLIMPCILADGSVRRLGQAAGHVTGGEVLPFVHGGQERDHHGLSA